MPDTRTTPVRWGIAGLGTIAAAVAADLPLVPEAELVAVGSRSAARAEAFAARHGFPRAHGSYTSLLADPEVEVVYVATPHPQHHALALAALQAGKAVLVEKAFTATHAGAVEVVEEARRRGLFAMEAMWTRFQPAVVRARELVAAGAIGELVGVEAELGFAAPFDPDHRLFAPALGGGALLDLAVYPVSFAQMLLGTPSSVAAVGRRAPTGVEAAATLLLGWDDGRSATLVTALDAPLPGAARILGTAGWIDVCPPFHHPSRLLVCDGSRHARPEVIDLAPTGRGYAHELLEVSRCLRAGLRESRVMPLDDTLAVMAVLQDAGAQLGVTWAEDPGVPV